MNRITAAVYSEAHFVLCLLISMVCGWDRTLVGRSFEDTLPNIVVFLADDAGWGDYSSSGNRQVRTPNIDSIASSGVKLDRFFVCPVCSPTRAEFLTGRYHARGGVRGVSEGAERLNLDETTLAESLRAANYKTGCFGKWHNGTQWPYHPCARGFQEFIGYTEGHWGEYFDPPLETTDGEIVRGKGYIVDICTDNALKFIEQHQKDPFFCYVPFTTPYSPWGVPAREWSRWTDRPIQQRGINQESERLEETRCALAMLENQDANVGRVLEKLRELDLFKNTILVYFSDNGPNTERWNGEMKGRKGTTDEGGVRSVCYIQWPKRIQPGKSIPSIAGAIDLLPTLLAMAGVSHVGKKPIDGVDLSPALLGNRSDWNPPDRYLFSMWNNKFSVRSNRFRLDTQSNLFDMVADPLQKKPLAMREPSLLREQERMKNALEAWKADVFQGKERAKDERPIPVGFPEFPITHLPARDGHAIGGIRRSASAPNSSYFVHWSQLEDAIVWDVEVATAGEFDVSIDYTCAAENVGSRVALTFGPSKLEATVNEAWDPPLYQNQDTIERPKGESRMKEFKTMTLGTISLDLGSGPLKLQATKIPGRGVIDLRRLTLRLRPTQKKSSAR